MKHLYLDQALAEYKQKDYYPYHMPGHKGISLSFPDPYAIDITEIENFDNLHEPVGILLESQKRASSLYGAKNSFYLVNGSTCGILSAISACLPRKGTLLLGRNSHKSVFHASFLRQLHLKYVMPEITDFGIQGSVNPDDVLTAIKKWPQIGAILITSPTYDGIVSDIKTIASIAHQHHIPLIVDEAHGAHFHFSEQFPAQALELGADIVIHSLHKTLPSFTQTALLHVNSERVNLERLKEFLSIYQTSSPSYLFMASMDRCIRFIENEGQAKFELFYKRLTNFYSRCKTLRNIKVYQVHGNSPTCYDKDISKIVISSGNNPSSGSKLYNILLDKYHLQMEMMSGHYVVALLSVMDGEDGFTRLYNALDEIDQSFICEQMSDHTENYSSTKDFYPTPVQNLTITEAIESPSKEVSIADSLGKISKEYLYLYPPGIPLLVPGEMITSDLLCSITKINQNRLKLHGLSDPLGLRINIVNS